MGRSQKGIYMLVCALMFLLIMDSRRVISAASEGMDLCIRTAIPSLFPFFVLSGILVPAVSRLRISALGRLLHVSSGWESVFLLSCVGGYPVGAQCIAQGYRAGQLSKAQAERMLGFCNNCGPSFLFGVIAPFFPHPGYALALYAVSIFSAIVLGVLWPAEEDHTVEVPCIPPVTLPKAVRQALSSMASVCAWIILGKIVITYTDLFLLRFVKPSIGVILNGAVELTNGCLRLGQIRDHSIRFLVGAFIIPFGGLCVAMQVSSICTEVGLSARSYLPQKLLQAILSVFLGIIIAAQKIIPICIFCAGLWILLKTAVAFRDKMMYNESRKGGFHHAVSKEN